MDNGGYNRQAGVIHCLRISGDVAVKQWLLDYRSQANIYIIGLNQRTQVAETNEPLRNESDRKTTILS